VATRLESIAAAKLVSKERIEERGEREGKLQKTVGKGKEEKSTPAGQELRGIPGTRKVCMSMRKS